MEHAPAKKFPLNAQDYELSEEIGNGVSATVYKALCVPLYEQVAIKVLDLEKCNSDLDGIRQEVHTMSLIDHPNVLRAYCSFPAGHSLWVVMPYMAGGSCLHIMKSAYPDGFEEPVIATLLHEVLKALVCLHSHGHIHRDVKAGNILVASNGSVKLADFGVSACMFETGDRQRCRNTFVGTPCWMAPEVMQQLQGYDFKADIWSFAITALELAHGHAPFSKYPPMKVLLMTLQNAPPGLDYERDKRFSNSFRELVGTCLEKDPKKRPSSEKLMKHPFFRRGRSAEYLARTILHGLPPLNERFSKEKEAGLLVQKKALYEDKEQLSQQQYIRGISAWNFNLEDLKSQAALDFDEAPNVEEYIKQEKHDKFPEWRITTDNVDLSNVSSNEEDDLSDLKSSLASFPIPSKPLDALKDCFDVGEDNVNESVMRSWEDPQLDSEGECQVRSRRQVISDHKKLLSTSSVSDSFASLKKITSDRDPLQSKRLPERMHSGHLGDCQNRDANNYSLGDGIQDGLVVQQKGRFKVTSGELSPKALINSSFSTMSGLSTSPVIPTNPNMDVTMLFSSVRRMLKWNEISRDELDQFLTTLEQLYGQHEQSADAGNTELMPASAPTEREKQLQNEVTSREQIIRLLEEELQIQKLKVSQLQLLLDMSSKNHQEDRTEKNE